jgi:hypothetical protein
MAIAAMPSQGSFAVVSITDRWQEVLFRAAGAFKELATLKRYNNYQRLSTKINKII